MKRMFGLLMMVGLVVGVLSGCGGDKDSPTGPTKGPEGQTLEVYTEKWDDGNVENEYQFYRNGNELIKHGFYKWYYESGKVKSEGNYVDGKREGKSVSYDQEGNITYEWCYEKGEEVDCP